jgi:hypothetical protein
MAAWRLDPLYKIVAIAMKGGAVDATIKQLKYPPWVRGWAIMVGRLVFGYIEANANHDGTGLIVANPTYVGAGSDRAVRHTELVIEAAAARTPSTGGRGTSPSRGRS